MKPWRELLEFILLLGGAFYALAFTIRTWPYPRATLSLDVLERASAGPESDDVVVRATFAVGDSANLELRPPETSCRLFDLKKECAGECTHIGTQVNEGTLPRGEALSWACRYRVPKGACVEVSQIVLGRAVGVSGGESQWGSSTISCGGKDK